MADCVGSDKKAKQAKLRLPLTYKRLIVWDIYGPLYVIGKRKQQGSSNFAPRQTSPRGIFCDDQSAFSIPLGINEKKAPRTHQVQTSMIAVTIWHHILLFPVIMGFIVKKWYFYKIWSTLPTGILTGTAYFLEEFLHEFCWQIHIKLICRLKQMASELL